MVAIIPKPALADSDAAGIVTKMDFTMVMPEPYRLATVSARLDERRESLASLEIVLGDAKVVIPTRAYEDLRKPNLSSLSLHFSASSKVTDPDWYAVLDFQYGDPKMPSPCEDREGQVRSLLEIREGDAPSFFRTGEAIRRS
jgi:hypothetical protein